MCLDSSTREDVITESVDGARDFDRWASFERVKTELNIMVRSLEESVDTEGLSDELRLIADNFIKTVEDRSLNF